MIVELGEQGSVRTHDWVGCQNSRIKHGENQVFNLAQTQLTVYVKQSGLIKNGNKVIGCPRRAGKCADATGPKKRHNHRDSISQMVVDWHIGPDTARSLPRVQMILGGGVVWAG